MTSATDNRTTELRDKLDALNIEHFDYDKGGRTQTQWEAPDGKRHFTYETSNNPAKTARLVIAWHPTPEQAIAATLGNYHGYEQAAIEAWESIKAWNARATYGTLTAEQVSKTVYAHSIHADCADADWQAIADELNATLGNGMCELAYGEDDEGYDGWYCQSCGGWFDAVRRGGKLVEPIRCGCCGREVRR